MAKKEFDWVEDEEAEPTAQRPSLSEKAVDPRRATGLAEQILAMGPAERARLELDGRLIEAIAVLDRIRPGNHASRRRQRAHIAALVLQHDLDVLEDGIGAGQAAKDAASDDLVRWRDRILAQGDGAITAFVSTYPEADRQQLRQVARQCAKAPEAKRSKLERKLFELLKASVP